MVMKIVFDDRWIGAHGIGRFAQEVGSRSKFTRLKLGGRPLDLVDPLRLGYALNTKQDHFFSPGYNVPLGKPCSFSFTLHDLMQLEVPALMSVAKTAYFEFLIKPAIKNSAVVFTVSEFSREKILQWSGASPDKVISVGNGVSPVFSPGGLRWQHARPYLLYVGNQRAHKNVDGLIRAFASSNLKTDFDLLLSGSLSDSVAAEIMKHHLMDCVMPLGEISENALPALYRGAHAFVMPSMYEGFGLPLVEAMACGTPVLSSNLTAMPQVCGNAALYFDPHDFESFVNGLNQLRNLELLFNLKEAGFKQVAQFNWDIVAHRVQSAIVKYG
jgi:glycosyltransferase involved in cell wall biosynthesis